MHVPTSSHPTTAVKRERRKEARPGELIEAALELFVEKGFAATRVDEVAARAGVSKGTLFLYFPSKEELFKAAVRENIAGRFAEWTLELDAFEGSTDDLLRYCYKVWWERIGNTKTSGITKLRTVDLQQGLAGMNRLPRGIHRQSFNPATKLRRHRHGAPLIHHQLADGSQRSLQALTTHRLSGHPQRLDAIRTDRDGGRAT